MNSWGTTSAQRRETLHPDLQMFVDAVLEIHDCTIIYGARAVAEQRRLVAEGLSKTMNSKHLPRYVDRDKLRPLADGGVSWAVDLAPYPVDWENTKRFYYFAGYAGAVAAALGLKIRWGGDWDGDQDLDDQTFMDLVHFELIRPKHTSLVLP